jgi:Zn-dependent protease
MRPFKKGAVEVGRLAGVPIRVHWSALLGAFAFTGFAFSPPRWACYFGLVVAHELGHALVVKACKAQALAIEVTGYGGQCAWRGDVSKVGRSCIAWGGVWAQVIVLCGALVFEEFADVGNSINAREALWALTASNAWLIAVNLLPIKPLDGSEAWALPFLLGKKARLRLVRVRKSPRVTGVDERDNAFDAGERRPEVDTIVSSLLEDARRDKP